MDITSPWLLKVKAALFVFLGVLTAGILLAPEFDWRRGLMLVICIWAFCRGYYFCFYVIQHYIDPSFRYAGLWDLLTRGIGGRNRKRGN